MVKYYQQLNFEKQLLKMEAYGSTDTKLLQNISQYFTLISSKNKTNDKIPSTIESLFIGKKKNHVTWKPRKFMLLDFMAYILLKVVDDLALLLNGPLDGCVSLYYKQVKNTIGI